MSHSPDELPEDAKLGDLDSAYLQSVVRLNHMLDRGVSWSGHEANCCFLNTGTGTFANVSAITGLDFLDDGRGLALVDWDRDGDLDAWTSNRTAPMLRFVRNDTPRDKHYLSVRLEGVDCNADAIGARVEVELSGQPTVRLLRTLHAGEGFLGQSSKWLHFGLGDNPHIVQLTVHWPNGEPEVFRHIRADYRYKIRQGTKEARRQSPTPTEYELGGEPLELPKPSARSRALLTSRLPLPPLRMETYDSREIDVTDLDDGPILLNLWASWCRPCLAELREFSEREEELRALGLNVYAANVDALGDDRGQAGTKHRAILDRLGYPFKAGSAKANMASQMEAVMNFVYGPNRPLPVPTSFLIDSSGRLAAIYKGGLSIDQLISDTATLQLERNELEKVALPFRGRWIGRPPGFRPLALAAELAENGIDADLLEFLNRNALLLSRDASYAKFAREIAIKLLSEDRRDEALQHLRKATNLAPQNADLWGQLGELQVQIHDTSGASHSLHKALSLDKQHAVANFQLGNLANRKGELTQAARYYERALASQPDLPNAHYQLAAVRFRQGRADDAVRHMQRFVELRPEDIDAQVNLGGILASLRRFDEAEKYLRKAVDAAPENSMARNNLGRVLQDQGKDVEAVAQFEVAMRNKLSTIPATMNLVRLLATSSQKQVRDVERALKLANKLVLATNRKRADVLEVLATAQEAAEQKDEAIKTCVEALRLAKSLKNGRLIARLRKTLERLNE